MKCPIVHLLVMAKLLNAMLTVWSQLKIYIYQLLNLQLRINRCQLMTDCRGVNFSADFHITFANYKNSQMEGICYAVLTNQHEGSV
jgi:hypothetical protein